MRAERGVAALGCPRERTFTVVGVRGGWVQATDVEDPGGEPWELWNPRIPSDSQRAVSRRGAFAESVKGAVEALLEAKGVSDLKVQVHRDTIRAGSVKIQVSPAALRRLVERLAAFLKAHVQELRVTHGSAMLSGSAVARPSAAQVCALDDLDAHRDSYEEVCPSSDAGAAHGQRLQ